MASTTKIMTALVALDVGHFDLVRAAEGHFAGGLFAIFVPPPGKEPEDGVFSTTLPSSGGEEVEEILDNRPQGEASSRNFKLVTAPTPASGLSNAPVAVSASI